MFGLTLIALVASASANVYFNTHCPVVKTVENFDLEAFGNGVWYEVARYPNDAEKGGQCSSAEYKLDGDIITVKNYHVADGKLASIVGSARLAPVTSNKGKLLFSLPYGAVSSGKTEYTLWVLDTDYVNYAVAYHCKYNPETRSRQDFAWIFSRTKTLDASIKAKIDRFIRESRVLDASKFIWPDFSDEACRITK